MKQLLKAFFALTLLAVALSAMSCGTAHKLRKATAVLAAHPKESAEYCVVHHPVEAFTRTDTMTIKGKPDTVYTEGEIVYADCSSAITAALDDAAKRRVPVRCPPAKTITITNTRVVHDTTVVKDLRLVNGLRSELSEAAKKLQSAEAKAVSRGHWALGLGLVLLFLIALLVIFNVAKFR